MKIKNIYTWENPELQQVNALESRSEKTLVENDEQKIVSLNGEWEFKLFDVASMVDLEEISKIAKWDSIFVPQPWQTQGYEQIDYTNIWYKFPLAFPKVARENPTGVYRKELSIDNIDKTKSYILKFGAADSCMRLFLNNKEIGMTKGSRYITEFDITPFIEQKNEIIAIVYKWSDGTYLEDQGQWWFSGLYRDVELVVEPKERINDFYVKTIRNDENKFTFELDLDTTFVNEKSVSIKLSKNEEIVYEEHIKTNEKHIYFSKDLVVEEWTAETPNLYKLEISYGGNVLRTNVGFREVKIEGQDFKINGKPIMFKGVNFHSYAPKNGKYETAEKVKEQLMLMKTHNINAVRTSHYPQPQFFYDLCDELGLYVISEADLEANGYLLSKFSVPANNKELEKAFVQRGTRMVRNYRNHASIIMWSLGNETGMGANFISMKNAMKEIDGTRPFHLESDFECEVADVHSRMYSHVENYEGAKHWIVTVDTPIDGKDSLGKVHESWMKKPRMECEYGHAMGTGPGSLVDYMDKFYEIKGWCGGFIWEWRDMGIWQHDENAPIFKEYFNYASDYATEPSSGNIIVMDGLVFANGKPQPGLIEYKAVCSPIHFTYKGKKLTITNRYDFKNLNNISTIAKIINQKNETVKSFEIILNDLLPRQSAEVVLPEFNMKSSEAYFLVLESKLMSDELPLQKGYEVQKTSFKIEHDANFESQFEAKETSWNVEESKFTLEVKQNNLKAVFDRTSGKLKCLAYKDQEIINNGPSFNMYRATIDNDLNNTNWNDIFFVNLVTDNLDTLSYFVDKDNNIVVKSRIISGGISQAWYFINTYEYRFCGENLIHFTMDSKLEFAVKPEEAFDLKTLIPEYVPRLGITFNLNKNLNDFTFFGRGPLETYNDMCVANAYGEYNTTTINSFTPNARPQSCANHFETVWFKTKNKDVEFEMHAYDSEHLFDFTYLPFSEKHIRGAKHLNRITPDSVNWLHIDYKQQGLGSNSCGPVALKKYWCKPESFKIKQIWQIK